MPKFVLEFILKYLQRITFLRTIAMALVAVLAVVIVLSTIHLGLILFEYITSPPLFMFDAEQVLEFLAVFLQIVIAMELLESLRVYISEDRFSIQVVILVAMTAVARKIIIMDIHKLDGVTLIGLAAIILTLSGAYLLIRVSRRLPRPLWTTRGSTRGKTKAENPEEGD